MTTKSASFILLAIFVFVLPLYAGWMTLETLP